MPRAWSSPDSVRTVCSDGLCAVTIAIRTPAACSPRSAERAALPPRSPFSRWPSAPAATNVSVWSKSKATTVRAPCDTTPNSRSIAAPCGRMRISDCSCRCFAMNSALISSARAEVSSAMTS